MGLVSSLLLIIGFIIIYMFIVEIFTILFRLTGLAPQKARFQVISLLTNSGFTTKESEIITVDTTRRKLAICTMIFGYSLTAIIISLIVNIFFNLSTEDLNQSMIALAIGIGVMIVLMVLFKQKWIKKPLEHAIEVIGNKILYGKGKNLILIIDNYGPMVIAEIKLNNLPSFFWGKTLIDSKIKEKYGIIVLFKRSNDSDPTMVEVNSYFYKGDTIIVVGNYKKIREAFEKGE